ncbi:hypothetical protein D3C78_1245720 [compost metagenome]
MEEICANGIIPSSFHIDGYRGGDGQRDGFLNGTNQQFISRARIGENLVYLLAGMVPNALCHLRCLAESRLGNDSLSGGNDQHQSGTL